MGSRLQLFLAKKVLQKDTNFEQAYEYIIVYIFISPYDTCMSQLYCTVNTGNKLTYYLLQAWQGNICRQRFPWKQKRKMGGEKMIQCLEAARDK